MKKKEKLKKPVGATLSKIENNGLMQIGNAELINLNSGTSNFIATSFGGDWPDRFYFFLANVPSNRGGMTANGNWPDQGHFVVSDTEGGWFDFKSYD